MSCFPELRLRVKKLQNIHGMVLHSFLVALVDFIIVGTELEAIRRSSASMAAPSRLRMVCVVDGALVLLVWFKIGLGLIFIVGTFIQLSAFGGLGGGERESGGEVLLLQCCELCCL